MPRYLFNLVSSCTQVPDREGIDLADAWAARREAFLVADELVRPSSPAQRHKWQGWSLQVTDERGGEVLLAPIGDVPANAPDGGEPLAPWTADRDDRGRRGGTRSDVYDKTLRLTAEAIRHDERCRLLKRAAVAEIELARKTARLSAELIERSRTLATNIWR